MKVKYLCFFTLGLISIWSCEQSNDSPNQVPSCEIISPSNSSQIPINEIVEVFIGTNDEDGEISEVRFYLNNVGIQSIKEPPYTYEWQTSEYQLGTYEIKCEAIDDKGGITEDKISVTLIENENYKINCEINEIIGVADIYTKIIYQIDENSFISPIECGLCWSKHENPTINDYVHYNDTSSGAFTQNIELESSTQYYFKSYAKLNNGSTVYSSVKSFNTPLHGWGVINGIDERILKVSFIDDRTANILTTNNNLYFTDDGFYSVEFQNNIDDSQGNSFVFLNKKKGFLHLLGIPSYLHMTEDGGFTWQKINIIDGEPGMGGYYFNNLRFIDENYGYSKVVLNNSEGIEIFVAFTKDGGYNWTRMDTPPEISSIQNILLFSKDIAFIYGETLAGKNVGYYKTAEFGEWIHLSILDQYSRLLDVKFMSSDAFLFSIIDNNYMYKLVKVKNWETHSVLLDEIKLFEFYIIDEHNFYFTESYKIETQKEFLGSYPQILSKYSNGMVEKQVTEDVKDMYITDKWDAYFVSDKGKIYRTTNGGSLIYD